MSSTSEKKSDFIVLVTGVLALHTCLWSVTSNALSGNLPLDTIEALSWGKEWQLGYFKHPPVSAWMIEAYVFIFGRADLSIYFFSFLCVSIGIVPIAILTFEKFGKEAGVYFLFLSVTTHFSTISAAEYNVNIGAFPFWGWTIFAYDRAEKTNKTMWWVALSVIGSAGLMAKYTHAALLISIFFWISIKKRFLFREYNLYLCVLLGVSLVSSHLIWMINNEFSTISYALDRSSAHGQKALDQLRNSSLFIVQFTYNIFPMIVVSVATLARNFIPQLEKIAWRRVWRLFLENNLLFLSGFPVLLWFCLSLLSGVEIQTMWSMPLSINFGVVFAVGLARICAPAARRRFQLAFICTYLLMLAIFIGIYTLAPFFKEYPKRMLHDGPALANILSEYLRENNIDSTRYVVGSEWEAGTAAWYLPSRPSVFKDGDENHSPWIDLEDLRNKGALYVSKKKPEQITSLCALPIKGVRHILWPAKNGVIYSDHPKIWIAVILPAQLAGTSRRTSPNCSENN